MAKKPNAFAHLRGYTDQGLEDLLQETEQELFALAGSRKKATPAELDRLRAQKQAILVEQKRRSDEIDRAEAAAWSPEKATA